MKGVKWYWKTFCATYYSDDFMFETAAKVYTNYDSDRICFQDGLVMDRNKFQV